VKRLKLLGNALAAIITALAFVSLLGVTILPGILGYKTYVVLSGSMEPAIHTGSVLVALPVAPRTLKVNDVIVYNRSDVSESVTHRIIQLNDEGGKPSFITRGDANGAPDSWTVQYNGATAGKIVLSVPLVGYAYHAIASPQGRLLFLVVPVLGLTLMWLAQIWHPAGRLERIDREVPRSMAPAAAGQVLAPAAAVLPNVTAKADAPPLPLRQ
jgi:signal peptidase I